MGLRQNAPRTTRISTFHFFKMAQQLMSGCFIPAQSRTTPTVGVRRSTCALARLAQKHIANVAGSKKSSSFMGVCDGFCAL